MVAYEAKTASEQSHARGTSPNLDFWLPALPFESRKPSRQGPHPIYRQGGPVIS